MDAIRRPASARPFRPDLLRAASRSGEIFSVAPPPQAPRQPHGRRQRPDAAEDSTAVKISPYAKGGPAKQIFDLVQGWIRAAPFDLFLDSRPLKIDFIFNESLRSMEYQTGEPRDDGDYSSFFAQHGKTELLAQSTQNLFSQVTLTGCHADRFNLLRERSRKRQGFPLSIGRDRAVCTAKLGFALVFKPLPLVDTIRCMLVGNLQIVKSKQKLATTKIPPMNLTTVTKSLLQREMRSRAVIHPVRSLRSARHLHASMCLKERKLSDNMLHAMHNILEVFADDDDLSETHRIQETLRNFAAVNKPLSKQIADAIMKKASLESIPLRTPRENRDANSMDEDFAMYEDCTVFLEYMVVYRVNRFDETPESLERIQVPLTLGSARFAARSHRDMTLTPLEVTTQWHAPITQIGATLPQPIAKELVLLAHPLEQQHSSGRGMKLTSLMKMFGNGVISIDVASTDRSGGNKRVDFRHSAIFSNRS